jgi:hypothetical protein
MTRMVGFYEPRHRCCSSHRNLFLGLGSYKARRLGSNIQTCRFGRRNQSSGSEKHVVAASQVTESCGPGHRILSLRIIQTCSSDKHVGWVIQTCSLGHTNLSFGHLWSYKILNSKKNIHNGSQIVHKNVTNLMVKTVSELESRVKNYRKKMKNGGFACMHASSSRDGKVGSFFFNKGGKWVT